jgi:hypothetical protein
MTSTWDEVSEKLKALAGNWPGWVALGSFALYLMGYLSLRFHLTALGIGTDLDVIDERYVFAGANFLVYFFSIAPIPIFLTLTLITIFWLPYRLLPKRLRGRIKQAPIGISKRLGPWWSNPNRLALAGIVLSVILIQFVMRQCFLLSNLLLAPYLSGPCWLLELLLDEGGGLQALYFSALEAGIALAAVCFFSTRRQANQTRLSQFLTVVLGSLIAIQFLFLPINYGILIGNKTLPRVTDLGGQAELKSGQEAWLVWEGTAGVTYLVRTKDQAGEQRSLITYPKKDVKRTEIIAYDSILRTLFAGQTCGE